jgi:NTP pyrophosphatase (non-canonical NTP hydrolase)
MTDSLRELLPCPFCGETACGTVGSVVGCASCDIWMTSKAWNRRALLAETPGECCCMNGYTSSVCPVHASPPSDQGLRDVAQRLLWAIDRAMVEDDYLPDGIDETLIDDLREALAAPPSDQGRAMRDILAERKRQDEKWGEQNHDPFHYLVILMEEVGELAQAALHKRHGGEASGHLREESVHTAAVAMAIIECLDRGDWAWGNHALASKKGGED